MPFCPNCGSYVSPGDNTCMCGTYVGGNEEGPDLENMTMEIFSKYDTLKSKYYNLNNQDLDDYSELLDDFKDLRDEIEPSNFPYDFEYPFSTLLMDLNRDISNLEHDINKMNDEY
ncbi:zinc ribbon domain-containing protein [Methanobrevibacter woesei]|uniref:zinc ribbon domain-containing protein n=1 Tax=Methanobrevibacter woesei TaxID=190976 RepID=UPI0039F50D72